MINTWKENTVHTFTDLDSSLAGDMLIYIASNAGLVLASCGQNEWGRLFM